VHMAAYAPLAVAIIVALALPRATARMRPASAARTLVAGAVAAAGSTLASLGLLAWLVIAALPQVAALGRWRTADLEAASPVPLPIAAAALGALLLIAVRIARHVGRRVPDFRSVLALERRLPSRGRPPRLVIVDEHSPVAHAVTALPGCSGHIVMSASLWHSLDDEAMRRAVIEHERSHLRHRHGLLVAIAEMAVAANPLLGRTAARLRYEVERWADEDAAGVTSRAVTAEAVATVAVATVQGFAALALNGVGVVSRIEALLREEPYGRRRAIGVVAAVSLVFVGAALATLHACRDTELLFEGLRRLRGS
jgi:Zn-dependent protease with chaperone function